jgi:hypothetical protein
MTEIIGWASSIILLLTLNQAGLQTMAGRHRRRRFKIAFRRAIFGFDRFYDLQLSGRKLGVYGDERHFDREQFGWFVSLVLLQTQKQKKGRRIIKRPFFGSTFAS